MNKQLLKWPMMMLSAGILFTACSKDNEGENHDEEVITTVTLKLTPQAGGDELSVSFDDPDGPGGNAPTQQDLVLAPNTTYRFELELLDKTKTPNANITGEVEEEGDAHRVYYQPSAGSGITISGLNNDANGIALGTTGTLTTTNAATGTLRVVLRHYGGNPPNKDANDAVDSPKASTDVDVTFNTSIQ